MHAEGAPRPRNLGTDVAVRSKGPATGKTPAKTPTSRKTTTTRKNPNKTKSSKASGKTRKSRKKSEPSSRAKDALGVTTPTAETVSAYRGPGRPIDSNNIWTPEHIAEVADQMWAYIQTTEIPLVSEFCSLFHVRFQRLGEFPELAEMREALQAKMSANTSRTGLALKTGEGPKGAFVAKLAANAGHYSLVDKLETETKSTVVTSYAIPENGREGRD